MIDHFANQLKNAEEGGWNKTKFLYFLQDETDPQVPVLDMKILPREDIDLLEKMIYVRHSGVIPVFK